MRRPAWAKPNVGGGVFKPHSIRTLFGRMDRVHARVHLQLAALPTSPVGLAAWMLDHDARSQEMIARAFDGKTEGLTRDDVLDNVTLYWLTNTGISSARLYWDTAQLGAGGFFDVRGVTLPVAVSAFPDEIYAAPRSWSERAYSNLIHYNKLDKGTHFAAWEQPEIFTTEVRAGFRSLR
jgi:pimeloyl-ACP methyl ester carboxylesterase